MKVLVTFTNDERTRAVVVVAPSWFARLFGAVVECGNIERRDDRWVWSTTGRHVDYRFDGSPITKALELQDIDTLPRPLPRAHVLPPQPWPRAPRPKAAP